MQICSPIPPQSCQLPRFSIINKICDVLNPNILIKALLSSRICWKIHFKWCISCLWFHLQQNNESSWCCDGVNIFMQYIVRHMGIQVFSLLVDLKRKVLDMHFTYIKYSVQIGTVYENIGTCQLCAVSRDEFSSVWYFRLHYIVPWSIPK
jgi:hypothetical protein